MNYRQELKEAKLVKMRMLDLYSVFDNVNKDILDLMTIHNYLYQDITHDDMLNKRLSNEDIEIINNILKHINLDNISDLLKELWYYQIFQDGNTRTLTAYLAIYLKVKGIDYDLEQNIDSNAIATNFKFCK